MTFKQKFFATGVSLHFLWFLWFIWLAGQPFTMVLTIMLIGVVAWFMGYWCGSKQLPNGSRLD